MQNLIRLVINVFLVIFVATALLTIAGLADLWFFHPAESKPHLPWLLTTVIAEVVGVIILIARQGFRYLPDVQVNKTAEETANFMTRFISHGTSVTIVSNRVGWLIDATKVQETIIDRARRGTRFEIITRQAVNRELCGRLKEAGVHFFVTDEEIAPEARFTLINADRSGAERLAIARGTHPHHEITIFDNSSGPQIIGLAKDIVRKSKEAVI